MAKRRKAYYVMEVDPFVAIGVAVLCLLISIPFWLGFVSVARIHTREDAKHVNTTILSWRESVARTPRRKSMLIICSDGNMYEIRQDLYRNYRDEVQSTLSAGAEASIYTGLVFKDIIELGINGQTVIPFEEGYDALRIDRASSAVLAAFLDISGLALLIYGIVGVIKERESKE